MFVCEGEKAADALRSVGLTATTSPHGAEAADKANWSALAGKEVIILPDNDTPGRKYAETVRDCLSVLQPAPVIKLLKLDGLPEKGDAFDWLEHRDATDPEVLRQELESLADAAPVYGAGEFNELAGVGTKPSRATQCGDPFQNNMANLNAPDQQTDLANARRFTQRFGADRRFVTKWNKPYIWDGRRWCEDAGNVRSMQMMQTIADDVWMGIDRNNASSVRFGTWSSSARGMLAALTLANAQNFRFHTMHLTPTRICSTARMARWS